MKIPPAISRWGGLACTVLPALALCASAYIKLSAPPMVIEQFVTKGGFPANTLMPIGILELFCTALFVIPQTSVLGAVLLTGYLGGATVVHVREAQSFAAPLILGAIVWLGIYLREERLHELLPVRTKGPGTSV